MLPVHGNCHHPDNDDEDDDDADADRDQRGPAAAEERLFSAYLTAAIDRDRAERLGEMIKTTGYQLNETYNRNKQFFN